MVAGLADAGEKEEEANTAPPTVSDLMQMVALLDVPEFEQRERASDALKSVALVHGDALRSPLVACYKNASSPEVRYRLYRVLLILADGMRPDAKPGFLGIAMLDSTVTLPDGEVAKSIIVRRVLEGTAADRSGLKLMDHIVKVDGKPMEAGTDPTDPTDTASARFSEYIRTKPAQAEVKLDVYKSQTRKLAIVNITLGERPVEHVDQIYKSKIANDVVKGWLGRSDK